MINKVIKNKQAARRVANEMKKDIHDYIDFFGGYQVNVVDDRTRYFVIVTSSSACKILTNSVVPYIMEVFNAYRLVYGSIGYCVTVVEYEDNDGYKDIRPAIQIEVYINDK